MDPGNAVVQLCVRGIEAEADGRVDEARDLFQAAWRASSDDVEACFAAHYMARQEPDAERALFWNQLALARADAVRGDRGVRGFYAALHLNLAIAHERLGQVAIARHHFERAAASVSDISESGHRVLVEYGVTRGLERTRGIQISS